MPGFFPNSAFGWTFYGVLLSLLAVATVIDWRRMVVPKWLAFTVLGLGVAFNVARGAWLGLDEQKVWVLGVNGPVVGALDGFLFALAGFLAGFGLLFIMWILGLAGGGDVKLFAALGAWAGPYCCLWIQAVAVCVLLVLSLGKTLLQFVRGGPGAALARGKIGSKKTPDRPVRPSRRGLTYSFSLAVATALVLLWFFRFDLLDVPPPRPGSGSGLQAGPPVAAELARK